MSDATFVHYVVCTICRRQLCIDGVAWLWIARGSKVVVGVRCCSTIYVNQGVTLGQIAVTDVDLKRVIAVDAVAAQKAQATTHQALTWRRV